MRKQKSKEEIINHKKQAIRKINGLLEDYIASSDEQSLKKVDLLAYWIEEFTKYIRSEEAFQPQKLMRYVRGSIIRVNFGFRVGSEMGGLHYAVVIDKENDRSSSVVTVIPLSSSDGRSVHRNNVDLGTELYAKATSQRNKLLENAKKELFEVVSLLDAINATQRDVSIELDKNDKIAQAEKQLLEKQSKIEQTLKIIERYDSELSKMKSGSIAVMNQITTISKQRIYTPKKSEDFLYGVSLSASSMDKINNKLLEKLIFG